LFTASFKAAAASMQAANTPGLQPDIADPMRAYTYNAQMTCSLAHAPV